MLSYLWCWCAVSEENNTVDDKSGQEFDHADGLKGQNHVVHAILDTDSQTANKGEWVQLLIC